MSDLTAAIAALADEAERWGKELDARVDQLFEDGKDVQGHRTVTARDVHNSYAKQLRALMPATTGEKS